MNQQPKHGVLHEVLSPAIEVGERVAVDAMLVRASFPKDNKGHYTPAAVRMTRTFERIVDATGFAPYVTEIRATEIEIASSDFGEGMVSLRIPRRAVKARIASARAC